MKADFSTRFLKFMIRCTNFFLKYEGFINQFSLKKGGDLTFSGFSVWIIDFVAIFFECFRLVFLTLLVRIYFFKLSFSF